MSGSEAGAGVAVVSACAGGGFSLGAAALRRVLRSELRALPVAVLSVAGATRGGKSFLLDFCLRYLRATPTARADGSWLGADDEPLEGFSWRGGCDRDTTGIQIWSEPFVLTKQNGDKVVVLLMDTQGTFDSRSTVRDSTTIFAMSTLLSSVQIFNLSGNIQEDHLQYLQLFTEYGKLAVEECGTPFQDLMFLVRDWSYAYQHPIGAAGGQQLLEKRLQIDENQDVELKEVRQHIQASFESVRCFLMPHPGLEVATSPTFKGCLADISKEFKDALVELVHGLFEENLTLKKVNGQEIQFHELAEYFESYMEMLNSEQMPTPVSILKATSAACLEAARGSARAIYEGYMSRAEEGGKSCSRAALLRRHAKAVSDAEDAFKQRRTLSAPERVSETLNLLTQELEGQFINYAALNDANTQANISTAKAAYKNRMLNITCCLLPSDFEERHREAVEEAIELFDRSRLPIDTYDKDPDQEDEDRVNLLKELENFLGLRDVITTNNEANIDAALASAVQKYEEGVCRSKAASTLCMLSEHLTRLHATAKEEAVEEFKSHWTTQDALDEPVSGLIDIINERLKQLQCINAINNENAVNSSVKYYENNMKYDILNNQCLHPLDFISEHRELYQSTIAAFYQCRTYGSNDVGRDTHKLKLITNLTKSQTTFIELNEKMNRDAVTAAHRFYETNMSINRPPDALPEFLGTPDTDLFNRHERMKPLAIERFYQLRRTDVRHAEDKYRDELIGLIDSSYRWLIAKFVSAGAVTIASIVLLRRFW